MHELFFGTKISILSDFPKTKGGGGRKELSSRRAQKKHRTDIIITTEHPIYSFCASQWNSSYKTEKPQRKTIRITHEDGGPSGTVLERTEETRFEKPKTSSDF